jgi:hypothetical protein
MAEEEKKRWQELILTAGEFRGDERTQILDYCWVDVHETADLLKAMLGRLPADLDPCFYRGRYASIATHSMYFGIPIDVPLRNQFLFDREHIQLEIARKCPVYDGVTFKMERFAAFLKQLGLLDQWPRTPSGRLKTTEETFEDFSRFPAIERLRQIDAVITQLRKPSFEVWRGRNYYQILPFLAETSRNSTKKCVFQASKWIRGLIQPQPGQALAYLDYEQQENLIAAVLARDERAIEAYAAGDPYTPFGIASGLMPPGATKESHPGERAIAKSANWLCNMEAEPEP